MNNIDPETKKLLTRTFISVVGSTAAAILGALAFRYIVIDRVFEDPSMNPSTIENDNIDSNTTKNHNNNNSKPGTPNYRKERLRLLNLNKYEAMLANDVIFPEEVDSNLSDIGGMQNIITIIKEKVLFPLSHQYLYSHSRILQRPTGILLYGPPGTGKTLLAKAIAKTSHAMFLSINIGNLQNKWYGETPKLITALFTLSKKLSPCILFLDEADGFLGSRGSGHANGNSQADVTAKTQFLQYWEGLTTNNNNSNSTNSSSSSWVLLIGATNRPDALDPAVLRRMPCQIQIGLPNYHNRIDILKVLLRYETIDLETIDFSKISTLTKGFSGSDLKEVIREAAMVPVREALQHYDIYNNSDILMHPLVDSPLKSTLQKNNNTVTVRNISTDDLLYGIKIVKPNIVTTAFASISDDENEHSNENINPEVIMGSSETTNIHSVPRQFTNQHSTDIPCTQCLQSLYHLSQHQHSSK